MKTAEEQDQEMEDRRVAEQAAHDDRRERMKDPKLPNVLKSYRGQVKR